MSTHTDTKTTTMEPSSRDKLASANPFGGKLYGVNGENGSCDPGSESISLGILTF